MNKEKINPILKGIIKNIPGIELILRKQTGETINSRYCYSVWMRHLINISNNSMSGVPDEVVELGPGHSLGTGFAALLSGCKRYYALDIIKNWDANISLKIFDELVNLFIKRERIPDNVEFPRLKPIIDNYSFPSNILTERLKKSLSDKRIEKIRKEIKDIDKKNEGEFIRYYIPYNDSGVIKSNSVDFIFSQAVLEYVDLENVYQAMNAWLKPNGIMSNEIDFKSHGTIGIWNGHWTFSDFEWKIVTGRKKNVINRMPLTKHIEYQNKYDFKIIKKIIHKRNSQLTRKMLSKRFKDLTDEDLSTSGVYLVSKKL